MKKESRIGILVHVDEYWGLCIFRGNFLEGFFFGTSKDEILNRFNLSTIKDEVMYTNFCYKNPIQNNYESLEKTCKNIVGIIGRKLNKLGMYTGKNIGDKS